MAAVYETLARYGSFGQFSRFYRAVSDAIEPDPGALLLDVGCGPGTLTPYLLSKVGGNGTILGIDVADKMVERAESRAAGYSWPNARFERVDVCDFSPSKPADIVVFCLSLTTMPSPHRCLSRAISWLRPGGQLVILDSFPEPDRLLAGLAIRMKSPMVGADPSALSLAEATSQLDSVRVRRFHGGVYTLLTGRTPR